MKRQIVLIIFVFYCFFSFCQRAEEKKLNKWIAKNNIIFNSPNCPSGFEHFINCNTIHAYRRIIGDTIIIYSRGGSIAEDISALTQSIKVKRFNVFRYPSYSQNNGTIVVQEMRKWTFLLRNDTLYLLDDYDEKKSEEAIKIMDAFFKGKINESEFKKQIEDNEGKDYGFKPMFKMIFFKGIFDNTSRCQFDKNLNFRKETVSLVKSWKKNGKQFFEINLDTWTAGIYIISEDFDFINTEICYE